MKSISFGRFSSAAVVSAVLAGCSTPLAPLSSGTAALPGMVQAARNGSLLYLSDVVANNVRVYSYPQRKLLGTLTGFGRPRSECADAAGDVWIVDVEAFQILEYAHGASQPSAALSTFGEPRGCSVDPKSGDVAVSGGISGTVLSVYHQSKHAIWRDPRRYKDGAFGAVDFCAYDDAGNLFVDGTSKGKRGTFRLAELPRGAGALRNLAIDQSVAAPGQLQWDGAYLAIGDAAASPSIVYEFSIAGSNATEVGSATLDDAQGLRQFWIQGDRLIGPDSTAHVDIWNYPDGGPRTKAIGALHGFGAAVSLP